MGEAMEKAGQWGIPTSLKVEVVIGTIIHD